MYCILEIKPDNSNLHLFKQIKQSFNKWLYMNINVSETDFILLNQIKNALSNNINQFQDQNKSCQIQRQNSSLVEPKQPHHHQKMICSFFSILITLISNLHDALKLPIVSTGRYLLESKSLS